MRSDTHTIYNAHPLFKCLSSQTAFAFNRQTCDQKHLNHFTRRLIVSGEKKKGKITFNWISPAFTGHFVQQSPLCSRCLGDKAHYVIVVHCVLTVGPAPDCWEWISWAPRPYFKAWSSKVKRQDLIIHTTYVDNRFLCLITPCIIRPRPPIVRCLLFKWQNEATQKVWEGRGGYGYWKIGNIFHLLFLIPPLKIVLKYLYEMRGLFFPREDTVFVCPRVGYSEYI